MAMPLDQLFASAILSVFTPQSSFEFPPKISTDEWLNVMKSENIERRQAFFDEQLQSLLLVRIKHPEGESFKAPDVPPDSIVDLLGHIQVTCEASYISAVPNVSPETTRTSRLLATPRTGALALAKPSGRLNQHPSILPPSTPNPTPATGDNDRKYVTSEGTPLLAQTWGANTSDNSPEEFALLWSEQDNSWIAVYRMSFTVSFIRLNFSDPLVCLTISATLREKPVTLTPRHPLSRFFTQNDKILPSFPESPSKGNVSHEDPDLLDGLEEVNLLEGLLGGPTFGGRDSDVNLPSIRLGTISRQKLFLLPPIIANSPVQPSPSPVTAARKAHPTLRKSYRKTLQTASGFRVRMRTVFVPFVILPETEGTIENLEEEEKQRARYEAGNVEKTVVLCVEIENFGDMGQTAGFLVESVQVSIGGGRAKATLIGWGDQGFTPDAAKHIFPLRIGRSAQYNLLYAVTFMRSPDEVEAFSFAQSQTNSAATDLHRAVTINVVGKPYFPTSPSSKTLIPDPDDMSYPTQSFSSRWNCVLDLSAHPRTDTLDANDLSTHPSVMPQPASPFPAYSANSGTPRQPYSAEMASTPLYSATAGSKKFAGVNFGARTLKILTPARSPYIRASDSARDTTPVMLSSRPTSQIVNAPPNSGAHYLRSPTTYSAPPPPSMSIPNQAPAHRGEVEEGHIPPPGVDTPTTPAFPPFTPKSGLPPTPTSFGPVSSSEGNVGQSVEIKRAKGSLIDTVPATPLPFVSGGFGEQKMLAKLQESGHSGENVVVSVGLLPDPSNSQTTRGVYLGPGKVFPLQVFTLDIFVFNQSLRLRRFEITCPDKRRRRKGGAEMGVCDGGNDVVRKMGYPGILPLESRVRIGPLRPSTCQSVRMDFLAVYPGVHSVDTLTLTDIETGFSVNLRSVLDVVVHDPND